MNQKIVFQLDDEGYFMGPTEADESPLEPGVFLVPGGCIEVEPPKVKTGHILRFLDDAWTHEKIPAQEPDQIPDTGPEDPSPPTAEQTFALRRYAYSAESDPIKTEADYDAIVSGNKPDYSGWLAKVAEIKERYPLPADGEA